MKLIAIKEHHLYNKTFLRGKRFVGGNVSVHILKDTAAKRRMLAHPMKLYTNRVGLAVTKKVGGAVERNRAKRIIRAAFSELTKERPIMTGFLIVIAARPSIKGKKMQDVKKDLEAAFGKLSMFKDGPKA